MWGIIILGFGGFALYKLGIVKPILNFIKEKIRFINHIVDSDKSSSLNISKFISKVKRQRKLNDEI